jgi:sRNA-binding protein
MTHTRKKLELIAATRLILVEKFPAAFLPKGAQKKPLKVGISDEVIAGLPDVDPRYLRWAITDYCVGPKYLRNMREGARRIDLAGNEAGEVTASEAMAAERQLLYMNAPRHLKSENDKLRAALKPFARYYDLNDCDELPADHALEVPVSDLRVAFQTLRPNAS